MTDTLRDELRAVAAQVAPYAVFDRALRTARRRQRLRLTGAAVTVVLIGLVVLSGLPTRLVDRFNTPGGPAEAAMPDRIAPPPTGYPRVQASPIGPIAVVFGGREWWPGIFEPEEHDVLGLVGASDERYRVFAVDPFATPGGSVLLSPDGATLAYPGGLLDLRSGTRKAADVTPVAWAPDSRTLLAGVAVSRDGLLLALVDARSGRRTDSKIVVGAGSGYGRLAAFAPDGRRFAYVTGGMLSVVAVDGLREERRFPLADSEELAGKGAWARDSDTIATTIDNSISLRDATTGAPDTAAQWTYGAPVSLLGWSRSREPVVVEYPAKGGVRVRTGTRVSLRATPEVTALDVAAELVASGQTRRGDPPRVGPVSLVVIVLLGAGLIAVIWVFRRPPAPPERPRSW